MEIFLFILLLGGLGLFWTSPSNKPTVIGNQKLNSRPSKFTTQSLLGKTLNFLLLRRNRSPHTHGSAALMSQKEVSKLLKKDNDGLIVDGHNGRLSLKECQNLAIVGGTGSGKSSKFVITNLISASPNSSLFVVDPSGELLSTSGKRLLEQGFLIRVLSFEGGASLTYNPLTLANDSPSINKVAALIVSSASEGKSSDSFWTDGATSCIALIIKALKQIPEHCNLVNVKYLLDTYTPDNNVVLEHFMAKYLKNEIDIAAWKGLMANDTKVLASFFSSAKVSLKIMDDQHLAKLTSSNSISFEEMRTRKVAFFLQFPEDQSTYYSPIVKILYTQLFNMCMRTGRSPGKDRHIFIMLEEFANIGLIGTSPGELSKIMTTIRKRNVCVCAILQAIEQLDAIYGKFSEAILAGGVNSKLLYGGLSQDSAEKISKMIGQTTIEDPKTGNRHARYLLTPDEIRGLPDDVAILLHKNNKAALIKVKAYYEIKEFKKYTTSKFVFRNGTKLPKLAFVPLDEFKPKNDTITQDNKGGSRNNNNITFDL